MLAGLIRAWNLLFLFYLSLLLGLKPQRAELYCFCVDLLLLLLLSHAAAKIAMSAIHKPPLMF